MLADGDKERECESEMSISFKILITNLSHKKYLYKTFNYFNSSSTREENTK